MMLEIKGQFGRNGLCKMKNGVPRGRFDVPKKRKSQKRKVRCSMFGVPESGSSGKENGDPREVSEAEGSTESL